jgi:uncharacterized protein YprB with RNaseH-like and TPR domain
MICFDIETGPLPEDQLRAMLPPFTPPPHPGEFDAAAVKLGNTKDPMLIEKKIETARQNHEATVLDYERQAEQAKESHWREFVAAAPMSALTGQVLAIGYRSEKATVIDHIDLHGGDITGETVLVEKFWLRYVKAKKDRRNLVGHNIAGFDIPFLIRRSWLLGIDVPDGIFDSNWRYLDRTFIDTMQRWQAGNYRDKFAGLDSLGKAFGLGNKTEGVDGGDFHRLYFGSQEERAKALEYLLRDIELTWMVAQRMGIV